MNTSPHTKHHLSLRKLRHHPLARIAFTLSAMAILWFFIKIPPADTFHTFLSSKEPVIFSRQCHDDPMHVLCQAIDSAQNSVFLRIYNLTSPELLMSLTSQAKKKHDVTLHYESMHAVKDFPISEEVTLQEHPVQGRKLMHKKALAIDHKYAWLGSANYTHTSLLHDDNLIIGLKSEELCTHIQNETSGACFVHEQLVEYFSLPKEEGKALSAVLRTLATAEKTIRIAMFALTYPPIFDALDQAQKRGVEVTILIDSSFKKLTLKQLRFLRNPLLKLYRKNTRYRLHHKFALIDEQTLIMGSANWSEGGFCLNSEDVLILHDLTQKQIKKMRRIWKALETQCIPVLYASSTPEKERQAA